MTERGLALLLLVACARPQVVARPQPHPLSTPHPRTDANQWTREDFIACRVNTDCHRSRR